MSRRLPLLNLPIIVLLAIGPVVGAHAGAQAGRGNQRHAERATLSEAVRRAERDTRGEVLSAERVMNDGRELHRVKIVDDQGRVRVFTRDPLRSGVQEGPSRPPHDDDN